MASEMVDVAAIQDQLQLAGIPMVGESAAFLATIRRLFDATSRPHAEHMEGSVEYAERLVNDPEMQRQFGGWRVIVEERYWESGHTRRPFNAVRRIPGGAGPAAR